MYYEIENWNEKYNHINIGKIDETDDDQLNWIIDLILKLANSTSIFFEWSRENFFIDKEACVEHEKLLQECFEKGENFQKIQFKKTKSYLGVGFLDDFKKIKQAMFHAWRGFEDASFFTSKDLEYKDFELKQQNNAITSSSKELFETFNADSIFFRNDVGDTLIIYSTNLHEIEEKIIKQGINKK